MRQDGGAGTIRDRLPRSLMCLRPNASFIVCALLLAGCGAGSATGSSQPTATSTPSDSSQPSEASTPTGSPYGESVAVTYEITVAGTLPPDATLFVRTFPVEPIKLMGGSLMAPQLTDPDGDGVYTTEHQQFDGIEYNIQVIQGVGKYTPVIGGEFPDEPTTVLHDFGAMTITEPQTLRVQVEVGPSASPEAVMLPSLNIARVLTTKVGDTESVWVLIEGRLFGSDDGGRTFTEPQEGWRLPDSDGVVLFPNIQRNLLILGEGFEGDYDHQSFTPIIGGVVGTTVHPPQGAQALNFAPDFATSGEILVVGADPTSLTNMWYSRDFGQSFEAIAFEENNYLDISTVYWGHDGVWILQSNRGDDPDSDSLISDVFFAPTPNGPWEREESWKDLGSGQQSVGRLFRGPSGNACLIVEQDHQGSDSRYVACKTERGWDNILDNALMLDDALVSGAVWFPEDGWVYTADEDHTDFYGFKPPYYSRVEVFLPNLPARIAVNDIDVSPSGTIFVATEIGLFSSSDGGETWTEATKTP